MVFGYGRVSTVDQNLHLQEDALRVAGCEEIFVEKITGTKKDRPELTKLRSRLRPGDSVVVWKLTRWGRSVTDLMELMNELRQKQVKFVCLGNSMDTETPEGRLMYGFFAVLAEFERDIIVENTRAGLASARARGRTGGRKPGLSKVGQQKADMVALMYKDNNTVSYICSTLDISRRTVYSYLRRKGVKLADG